MAMYTFTLTGVRKGKTLTLLDKYHFVDGEMTVIGRDAKKMRPLLVDYFACTMTKVEDKNADEEVDTEEEDE